MFVIVAYDIPDNRRRTKMMKLLKVTAGMCKRASSVRSGTQRLSGNEPADAAAHQLARRQRALLPPVPARYPGSRPMAWANPCMCAKRSRSCDLHDPIQTKRAFVPAQLAARRQVFAAPTSSTLSGRTRRWVTAPCVSA